MGLWLSAPKDLKSHFRLCYLDASSRHMLQLALGPHQCNNDWLLDACYHGYENLIDFPLETKHIAEFARGGQLELLKRQEIPKSCLVFEAAGIGGHLDVIEYLISKYNNGFYFPWLLYGAAARTQHFLKIDRILSLPNCLRVKALCKYNRIDILQQISVPEDDYQFYNEVFHHTEDRTELLQFIYDRARFKEVWLGYLQQYASIEQIRWIENKGVEIKNLAYFPHMTEKRTCPMVREWLLLNADKFI